MEFKRPTSALYRSRGKKIEMFLCTAIKKANCSGNAGSKEASDQSERREKSTRSEQDLRHGGFGENVTRNRTKVPNASHLTAGSEGGNEKEKITPKVPGL